MELFNTIEHLKYLFWYSQSWNIHIKQTDSHGVRTCLLPSMVGWRGWFLD